MIVMNSTLNFFHLNISSLPKHFDNLSFLLDSLDHNFDIIRITETRIHDSSIPVNLALPGFSNLFTKTEAAAGGTCLYVRNQLSCKARNDLTLYSPKQLW